MADDQRLPLNRLSGSGCAPGQAPIWDGRVFRPGTPSDSHVSVGTDSVAVGESAAARDQSSTALGEGAGTAIGATNGTALGAYSNVGGTAVDGIAVGASAQAVAARAIAIGKGASSSVADRTVVKSNDLELVPSNTGTATGTSIILRDTATGTRYRLSVTNGALSITAA